MSRGGIQRSSVSREMRIWLPNGSVWASAANWRTSCRAVPRITPHPGPGRSVDNGTTRLLAPTHGACALPTTSNSSPLQSKACPKPLPARRLGEDHRSRRMRVRGNSCCTRSAAWRRPPGASSRPALTATATRSGVTAPSNPDHTEAEPDRRGGGGYRGQHVAPGHPDPSGIVMSTPAIGDTDKPGSDCLQPARRPAQPTPHHRRRHPQARTDPAMPQPSARAVKVAQILSAANALRNNMATGDNTGFTAQARQRARRGRTGSAKPAILRARA